MTTTSTTTRRHRRFKTGQAAVETAIWLIAFTLVAVAIVQLGGALLVGDDQLEYARRDAGLAALSQSTGTREHGNASAIAAAAKPRAEGSVHALPPDPWSYPQRVLPNSADRTTPGQAGSPDAVELRSGSSSKRVDITFSYMGMSLFPNGLHLSEHVYLPPTQLP